MPAFAHVRRPAQTPEELHAIVAHAFNAGDLEAFTDAHDDDATVVVPLDGRSVHGRDQIRAAVAPLFELRPRMTIVVLKKIETDGLALTHRRWQLVVTEEGCQSSLRGVGTMVSRRRPDGTWRILLDDPLTGTAHDPVGLVDLADTAAARRRVPLRCGHCGWPLEDTAALSIHRTSEGLISSRRCVCGRIFLERNGAVLAGAGPATPTAYPASRQADRSHARPARRDVSP